jgi:hypothetical protein
VYVGRTCKNPSCERCGAAAIRDRVITDAAKLYGLGGDLYKNVYDGREDVNLNHVVASLPDVLVDSDEPIEHVLKILKELLEKKWHIQGFQAIYHPYRIKDEYRNDQYDHHGEPGRGDMTWSDVMDAEDPYDYLKHEPHFHLFFPAKRYQFDYSIVENVQQESGWVFHRIEKENSHTSVYNLADLVHQLTYCYSHCGVIEADGQTKFAQRKKGRLHNIDALDNIVEQTTAAFCSAAPKLLGETFKDMSEATCKAAPCDCDGDECHCEDDHPLYDLYERWNDTLDPDETADTPTAAPSFDNDPSSASGGSGGTASRSEWTSDGRSLTSEGVSSGPSMIADGGPTCDGDLVPIREAKALLEDDDWCNQARYSDALELAYQEWQDLDEDDLLLSEAVRSPGD